MLLAFPRLLFPFLDLSNTEFDPFLYVGHLMALIHVDAHHHAQ